MRDNIKRNGSMYYFLWLFIGSVLGSVLLNLLLGQTILYNTQNYSLKVLGEYATITNKYELFTFLLLQRGVLFGVFVAGLYFFSKRYVGQVFCFCVSIIAGVIISSQVICSGISALYEMLLMAFPHIFLYFLGMYYAMKKYISGTYGSMIIILLVSYLAGVFTESYFSSWFLNLLYWFLYIIIVWILRILSYNKKAVQ